jgi:hypothetical protein
MFYSHNAAIYPLSDCSYFSSYSVDVALDKSLVSKASLKDGVAKAKARKEVKSKFLAQYKKGSDKWFFQKLRF